MVTPHLLLILDGWGYREPAPDNAIAVAHTPVWDALWARAPHALLSASGIDVGVPEGQMGNSEVGHTCLGGGRIVQQSITRIEQAIADDSFQNNPAFERALKKAAAKQRDAHIFGLLSEGGVHSHQRHFLTLLKLAANSGVKNVFAHVFGDGRDTPPKSLETALSALQSECEQHSNCRIASLCGRYFAMDRDHRWERTQLAWEALTQASERFPRAESAQQALEQAYARGESDEFIQPTILGAGKPLCDGDAALFVNFRADRMRQLCAALLDDDFDGFERVKRPHPVHAVTMCEYSKNLRNYAECAFPPQTINDSLGEVIAAHGKTQLRIAETEKYAHVTFFFSAGNEQPLPGEERILVPSPQVATYDLKPEMSVFEVTDALCKALKSQRFDLLVCNFANGDMVGHTGNLKATIKAVESIDRCLGQVLSTLEETNGATLITADHGNCERMNDLESGQKHTAHTCEPVPLVYSGRRALSLRDGRLGDVAPTLLELMELPRPAAMTGQSLITH